MLQPSAFLSLLFLLAASAAAHGGDYNRADFPADFVFGSGTSAYQVSFTVLVRMIRTLQSSSLVG